MISSVLYIYMEMIYLSSIKLRKIVLSNEFKELNTNVLNIYTIVFNIKVIVCMYLKP